MKAATECAPFAGPASLAVTRRRVLACASAAGLGSSLFPGALLAVAAGCAEAHAQRSGVADAAASPLAPITTAMIEQAAAIAGVSFTEDQRRAMLASLNAQRNNLAEVRTIALPNSMAPSLVQNPVLPGTRLNTERTPARYSQTVPLAVAGQSMEPAALEALAFQSVREWAELLRTRRVSSTALTRMYIGRIRRLDPQLHFLVTLTEQRALRQAEQADRDIAAGHYKGPLHGVPWGAKDLLAVQGYPTTWGAGPYMDQSFDFDAEVVKRLDAAGAVLVAKLSLGALAQGDLWGPAPGTRTRNPWNPRQGSSGSSAGVASAVAAGCVGFGIGTETLGSISSPCTRCGATGLRPSFGLVPRTGAMALSWSMDKLGPIARSVEDCALVLDAIYGPDGQDPSVQPAAFNPDFTIDVRKLRVGYLKSAFDAPALTALPPPSETLAGKELEAYTARLAARQGAYERSRYDAQFHARALETLRGMGIALQACELPTFNFGALTPMLEAEAAAAFDELTRSGRDSLLAGQTASDWPNQFRAARLYPAVDYINASRARRLAMEAMRDFFAPFDVVVTPSSGAQLTATNLCGQPAVIVPNGLRGAEAPPAPSLEDGAPANSGGPGTPVSLTFLAPLYGDAKACALAAAYQQKTGFHLQHPRLAS